ncbi:MAG: hypothetical protein KGK16_05410 [Bradyrhizobium sp.]|nr:hypothetical protein [Bradyrhizobium sp.]
MSISSRAFTALSVLSAAATMFASVASAADYNLDRGHRVHPRVHHRYGFVYAPDELIAGVRGASPLTVPFFGDGWFPGPVHYYEASPGLCCYSASEPSISVMY